MQRRLLSLQLCVDGRWLLCLEEDCGRGEVVVVVDEVEELLIGFYSTRRGDSC